MEPVIVEKNGKPFAVIISPEQYEALQKAIERAWATVDTVRERNADKDLDEVLRHVTEVVEAVRQEMYEEERTAKRRRCYQPRRQRPHPAAGLSLQTR